MRLYISHRRLEAYSKDFKHRFFRVWKHNNLYTITYNLPQPCKWVVGCVDN